MMRKQVISEEGKQYQSQRAQEKELITLTNQYFILDKGYSHSRFKKDSTLLRVEKVLQVFHKEHTNILLDLQRAEAPGRIREEEKHFDELSRYLDENANFSETTHRYRKYLIELEQERKNVQKAVQLLRRQQYTDRQHERRVSDAIKTVEALENKLETQMIQFGMICTMNKKLRDELDHHLGYRCMFMIQWEKLIDKLTEGKKIMLDLIEQATLAYNQREELCTKLHILKAKALHDLQNNVQEMTEIQRKCDQTSKLVDFFFVKGKKRVMYDLQRKEQEKRKIAEKNLRDKLTTYQNYLNDIVEFAKEKKVKVVANTFVKQEELNMSNFKYIIDAIETAEIENDRLGDLYFEIDELYILHDVRMLQQKRTLEDLQFNLHDAESDTKEALSLLKQTDDELNELLQGVSTLFANCKCDKDPLVRLLGDNRNVDVYNVQLYIKILESKIHQLLIAASYQDEKVEDTEKLIIPKPEVPRIYTIDEIVPATPCSLCVEHEMVSDVIDILQPIWSRNEVKHRLKIKLIMPGGKTRLHNISKCQLPKARQLIQRRYE